MWWVWPPPGVLGVGLVLVLAAGGVVVRRCCCGTLLCFALLYCLLRAVVCWRVPSCASVGCGVLRCVVCYAASALCATSMSGGGRGYPGRAAPPVGAEFGEPLKRFDRAAQPLAGPSPSPQGPPLRFALVPCVRAAVAVCGWSARVVGLAPPPPGRWVLGWCWCWCLRRVVWLSAAVVVVHCFALFCYIVCMLASFVVCLRRLRRAALRCALRCLHEAWRPRLPGQGHSSLQGRVRVTSEVLG